MSSCSDTASDNWVKIRTILDDVIKTFIPAIKSSNWKSKESWHHPMGKDIRDIINKKHRLWRRYQETKDVNIYNEYKHIRNLARKETRKLAQKVQYDIAKSCKQNPKLFWQYVKSKTSSPSGIGDLVIQEDNNSRIISKDHDKAEQFSNFFASIYSIESNDQFLKKIHN